MKEKEFNTILLTSAAIFIAAQLDFTIFNLEFKISMAAVVIATIAFVIDYRKLLPIYSLAILACIVSRIIRSLPSGAGFADSFMNSWPEAVFFLSFCIWVFLYMLTFDGVMKRRFYVPWIIFGDFVSNEIELIIRMGGALADGYMHQILILIAVIRGIFLWGILTFMTNYRLSLQRKSEIERYHRIMIMISKMRGEIIWMKKNTTLIENTMNTSFSLYKEIQKEDRPELAAKALSVANDIHEVKREYFLIMQGLADAIEGESNRDGMELSAILGLIKDSVSGTGGPLHSIAVEMEGDWYTDKPYQYMTVLNNLVTNAIEAGKEADSVDISVKVRRAEDMIRISVSDNGPGIPEEYREKIFNAGFSTKINYETGQISRGLGLCHVREIVEEELHGRINLADRENGTEFIVEVPESELKKL